MKQPFPPCPVCGGTQAFFNGSSATDASIKITIGNWGAGIRLGALICMNCSHTELRPHPGDMGRLRAEVEKRGVLPS